jgi:hypothetical protein
MQSAKPGVGKDKRQKAKDKSVPKEIIAETLPSTPLLCCKANFFLSFFPFLNFLL